VFAAPPDAVPLEFATPPDAVPPELVTPPVVVPLVPPPSPVSFGASLVQLPSTKSTVKTTTRRAIAERDVRAMIGERKELSDRGRCASS
jgi:hypothetical protein